MSRHCQQKLLSHTQLLGASKDILGHKKRSDDACHEHPGETVQTSPACEDTMTNDKLSTKGLLQLAEPSPGEGDPAMEFLLSLRKANRHGNLGPPRVWECLLRLGPCRR